ncbi:sigma 54-interacting transcriptional regulator [Bacillus sp. Sa1BUA2]|uniref:Sigma 54-interacting transcriptional regulator n=2 Tax=Bacillus norwichensis TaxID=2762217 RepID=A0ABR8VPG1_9BACI|nr:sigma 54-interacting transcriptional regulator [Bacillus norwichensis]
MAIRKEKISSNDFFQVKRWMNTEPLCICSTQTVGEAAKIMEQAGIAVMPVVGENDQLIGLLSFRMILSNFLQDSIGSSLIEDVPVYLYDSVRSTDQMTDILQMQVECLPVVDPDNKIVGIITPKEMLDFYTKSMSTFQKKRNAIEILSSILESAYEGIAVVDEFGILIEFNEAYSRFTGISREEAIGRHVTEVIDNTNLHATVKTAIPERSVIQNIQGQDMVVHRIPIWEGKRVVGAIGMLIFEGVTEIYKIYENLQMNYRNKKQEGSPYSKKIKNNDAESSQVLGTSKEISEVKHIARRAAKTAATVLITGESGTGKEVFARNIHHLSSSRGPFVSVNCGAIPEALFESELFGYEEGAFTGAKKGGKQGKFELAEKGTIFLDEIGEMPLTMQTKLLRVLQEKEAERVGGVTKYKINARIIAATNKDLEEMISNKTFREDLFYRLNIINIHVPPLRERSQDIPILLSYYLKEVCNKYHIPMKSFNPEAVSALMSYPWKGNIRELINTIEQIVTLVDSQEIHLVHLPNSIKKMQWNQAEKVINVKSVSLLEKAKNVAEQVEKESIIKALTRAGGNKTKAAELLGIHRTTLYQKLKKHDID